MGCFALENTNLVVSTLSGYGKTDASFGNGIEYMEEVRGCSSCEIMLGHFYSPEVIVWPSIPTCHLLFRQLAQPPGWMSQPSNLLT
jgi:hypothetical protein